MATSNHKYSIQLSELSERLNQDIFQIAKDKNLKMTSQGELFDFNSAIKAHIDWKMKLGKYLESPDGSLDHSKVCLDHTCKLGEWIYGDGQAHSQKAPRLFQDLKRSHAEFHKTAGKIVEYINAGRKSEAVVLLKPHGKYSTVSDETVQLIQKLQAEIEESKAS